MAISETKIWHTVGVHSYVLNLALIGKWGWAIELPKIQNLVQISVFRLQRQQYEPKKLKFVVMFHK